VKNRSALVSLTALTLGLAFLVSVTPIDARADSSGEEPIEGSQGPGPDPIEPPAGPAVAEQDPGPSVVAEDSEVSGQEPSTDVSSPDPSDRVSDSPEASADGETPDPAPGPVDLTATDGAPASVTPDDAATTLAANQTSGSEPAGPAEVVPASGQTEGPGTPSTSGQTSPFSGLTNLLGDTARRAREGLENANRVQRLHLDDPRHRADAEYVSDFMQRNFQDGRLTRGVLSDQQARRGQMAIRGVAEAGHPFVARRMARGGRGPFARRGWSESLPQVDHGLAEFASGVDRMGITAADGGLTPAGRAASPSEWREFGTRLSRLMGNVETRANELGLPQGGFPNGFPAEFPQWVITPPGQRPLLPPGSRPGPSSPRGRGP
jgi:hypothetical protein